MDTNEPRFNTRPKADWKWDIAGLFYLVVLVATAYLLPDQPLSTFPTLRLISEQVALNVPFVGYLAQVSTHPELTRCFLSFLVLSIPFTALLLFIGLPRKETLEKMRSKKAILVASTLLFGGAIYVVGNYDPSTIAESGTEPTRVVQAITSSRLGLSFIGGSIGLLVSAYFALLAFGIANFKKF
jgi:hypothetical protein